MTEIVAGKHIRDADFRMKVNQMIRTSLTLEILVSGNNLRVISGMNFNNKSTP